MIVEFTLITLNQSHTTSPVDNPRMLAHVVFLPFPVQGHIKPFLMLAKLLSYFAGFQVTFVNTHYNQDRFQRFNDIAEFYRRFPKFLFMPVSDGLPSDHPRSRRVGLDLISSTRAVTKQEFHRLLINLGKENIRQRTPPTCIIADGIMSFALDIGEELQIPVISFRTFSASCVWTYFHLSKLVKGQVPIHDMDKAITCVPGLEEFLRCRDLPSICRRKEADGILQFFIDEMEAMSRASGLILNTFDGIEAPMISNLGSFFSKIYSLGPLHGLVENFIDKSSTSASSNGMLWQEDENCIKWLDSQPPRSVIYVSFGSLIVISRDQLLEFWHGLVDSGKRFLWVIRPDLLLDENEEAGQVPVELEKATKERGCIVSWAPQVEVLHHPATSGFLTHSGWNSTLESILAGKPMICWPVIGDQQVNSRLISKLWRIGFDMKDTCDRLTVEKMVKDLMDTKREEIMKSMDEIATTAADSVKKGGCSYCNLEKLIEDIQSMT